MPTELDPELLFQAYLVTGEMIVAARKLAEITARLGLDDELMKATDTLQDLRELRLAFEPDEPEEFDEVEAMELGE